MSDAPASTHPSLPPQASAPRVEPDHRRTELGFARDDSRRTSLPRRRTAANDRFGSPLGLSRGYQMVLNQSHFIGHRSRLYAICHVQRLEERGNMDLDGFLRKTKLATDFLVRTAFAKQPQHVALPDS